MTSVKEDSMTQPSKIRRITRIVWMAVLTAAFLLMSDRARAENEHEHGRLRVTSFPTGAHVSVDGADVRYHVAADHGAARYGAEYHDAPADGA